MATGLRGEIGRFQVSAPVLNVRWQSRCASMESEGVISTLSDRSRSRNCEGGYLSGTAIAHRHSW